MYLPEDIINSEFPNLKLKSKDGKTVTLVFDNGENVVISKQNDDGTNDSELYTFNSVNDKSVWPDGPKLPDYLAKLSLDQFNGIINSDSRDDYNGNVKHIQETVNGLYDYSVSQNNYFDKLKDVFGNFKGFVETIISAKTAEFLSKFSDQYYKKEDVDNEVRILQSQIDHLKNENPTSNGIKKPGVF